MTKLAKVVLVVASVLSIVIFIAVSGFIGIQVFSGSTQLVTNERTSGVDEALLATYGVDYQSFRGTYRVEELSIPSTLGDHVVPADYIYAGESQGNRDHRTVILVHGLGGNRYSNYPLAEFFLQQGYNVVTYDQRSSNQNYARYTTFGYLEKHDLIDWVNYVRGQAPHQRIGVWGASFGGATAGLALGYDDMHEKVDFLILDSPVSSMEWMIGQEMREMNVGVLAPYMTWCGSIVNRLKLGFTYQDADVPSAMKRVSTPVLIINSRLDSLTPHFMGQDIYDALQGENKEIWTVDDSEHFEVWTDHNQEYRDRVVSFLKRHAEVTEQ